MNRWVFIALFSLSLAACGKDDSLTGPSGLKTISFQAISEGCCIVGGTSLGNARFIRNGKMLEGSSRISRGFNIAAISMTTSELLGPIQNFDTWHGSGYPPGFFGGHDYWQEMIGFLNSLPDNTLILIAVEDEAGLTYGANGGCGGANPAAQNPDCASHLNRPDINAGRQLIQSLGSTMIQKYAYHNSWSMTTIKGRGKQDESLQVTSPATSSYTLTLPQ